MTEKPPDKKIACAVYRICIGLLLGGFLGLVAGNLFLFSGGGMILGLAIGFSMDSSCKGISL